MLYAGWSCISAISNADEQMQALSAYFIECHIAICGYVQDGNVT